MKRKGIVIGVGLMAIAWLLFSFVLSNNFFRRVIGDTGRTRFNERLFYGMLILGLAVLIGSIGVLIFRRKESSVAESTKVDSKAFKGQIKKRIAAEILFLTLLAISFFGVQVYVHFYEASRRQLISKNEEVLKNYSPKLKPPPPPPAEKWTPPLDAVPVEDLDLISVEIDSVKTINETLENQIQSRNDDWQASIMILLAAILFPIRYSVLIIIWAIKTVRSSSQ